MITKITNGKIIGTDKKNLYFDNGIITDITDESLPCDEIIDAGGDYISPGFIDTHTHGAGGVDFLDGESIDDALQAQSRFGATTVFPTITTASPESVNKGIRSIKKAMGSSCINVAGIHMEGPYFSPAQAGAQDKRYLCTPDKKHYTELIALGEGAIKKWSFAPELAGSEAFCADILQQGIVPSIGHSDGTYDDVLRIYNAGCRLMTHFYSGMSSIIRVNGFRHLGLIESAYLFDDLDVEIIADGCHLPPELLRLIVKGKKAEHICLVTDSMRAAGTDAEESVLGEKDDGLACVIEDGVAKITDRSAFAGSIATCDRLVRVMVKQAGTSLEDAVSMLTSVPARIMGLDKKGRLEKGCDADIVIFDEDINVKKVLVGGVAKKERINFK